MVGQGWGARMGAGRMPLAGGLPPTPSDPRAAPPPHTPPIHTPHHPVGISTLWMGLGYRYYTFYSTLSGDDKWVEEGRGRGGGGRSSGAGRTWLEGLV
jgi:hypothetical protein